MPNDLSLDHKKAALSEIASFINVFASLRFKKKKNGCLSQHGLGPLVSPCYSSPKGPFASAPDCLKSFVSPDSVESPELADLFRRVQVPLTNFVRDNITLYLDPPFSMIHADFDGQNMLFVDSPDGSGPKFTGLIDFEFAHTGPVYFLYEYPIFIQDVSWSKHLYAENAILRHTLSLRYLAFITSINSNCFLPNSFQDSFMSMKCSEDTLIKSATYYLKSLKDETGLAYAGRLDYKPEQYSEEGKPVS